MMSSKKLFVVPLIATLVSVVAAAAPTVDPNSPLTALGREDDIRIDAQLLQDEVASGSAVGLNVQIQNFTDKPVAIAEKLCEASFDPETGTVTLSVGSEIPPDGLLPHLTTVAPGEAKTFSTGAVLRSIRANVRSAFAAVPRYVQVKVNVLRNLAPFAALLQRQSQLPPSSRLELNEQQFETWLESSDTIMLNPVPVRFNGRRRSFGADASQGAAGGSF